MPDLFSPASVDEALRMLAAMPDARPVAGGLAILLRASLGEAPAGRLVAIGQLDDLRVIRSEADGGSWVGAGVTLAELERSAFIAARVPLLGRAATMVGSPGIRTTATLGGNLLDQPAASDLAAVALALDAEAVWASGPGTTVRHPLASLLHERRQEPIPGLLIGLRFAPGAPAMTRTGWGFERLQTRGRGDRATATVAVVVSSVDMRRWTGRGWATSIADRPIDLRATLSRTLLILAAASGDPGRTEDASIAEALRLDLPAGSVIDDARASGRYRQRIMPVLVRRAAAAALAAARAGATSTSGTGPP